MKPLETPEVLAERVFVVDLPSRPRKAAVHAIRADREQFLGFAADLLDAIDRGADPAPILWEKRGELEVCRACGHVREGTAASTFQHRARCAAAVVHGLALRLRAVEKKNQLTTGREP